MRTPGAPACEAGAPPPPKRFRKKLNRSGPGYYPSRQVLRLPDTRVLLLHTHSSLSQQFGLLCYGRSTRLRCAGGLRAGNSSPLRLGRLALVNVDGPFEERPVINGDALGIDVAVQHGRLLQL